jgi:hypothetical protein
MERKSETLQPVTQISFCCLVSSLNLGFSYFTAEGAKTAEIKPRGFLESPVYSAISAVKAFVS